MAYTAWSVVYGEQPTAAKWNQLGQNDAGFKDGTNIDAGAINSSHLAAGAALANLTDTGYVAITPVSGYSSSAYVRRVGKTVTCYGQITKTSGNLVSGQAAQLPAGFYPDGGTHYMSCPGASATASKVGVATDGSVVVVGPDATNYFMLAGASWQTP